MNTISEKATAEELKNFVGSGDYHHKWKTMEEKNSRLAGFNFWAFLFVHTFFFYRKMYTWGFIFIAADIALAFVIALLYAYIGSRFSLFLGVEQLKQHLIIVGVATSLMVRGTSGLLANKIYYSHALYAIKEISKRSLSAELRYLAIKSSGGVSMAGFLLGFLISAVVNFMPR